MNYDLNNKQIRGDGKISYLNSENEKLLIESTNLSSLSDEEDKFSSLSTSAMLAKGEVPPSHKRAADAYMVIKKIYGFTVVQSRITNQERNLLTKYDFNPLEYSTIKQINEELGCLKRWSVAIDKQLRIDADEIINIRVKELKYIMATKYVRNSEEIYKGFMALEKYFEEISKY